MKKKFSFIATLLCMFVAFAQNYKPIRGMGIKVNLSQSGFSLPSNSSNFYNIIDADLDNGVSLGSLLNSGNNSMNNNGIAIVNTNTLYQAGTVTGFNVNMMNSVLTSSVLNALTIATYKDGVFQEASSPGSLNTTPDFGGLKLRSFLYFKTTKAFNEIRLIRSSNVCDDLLVYYSFICNPNVTPENNGIYDDIIGGGFPDLDTNISYEGNYSVSPLSMIVGRDKMIDGNKNSYGTIKLPSGINAKFSLGIFDKSQSYPAGNRAGFVISTVNSGGIFSKEMLNNLTIETYLYGQLQNSQSYNNGGGALNVASLNAGSDRQKISIITTRPFNEIRLKISQNSSGVNMGSINVHYAFEEPKDDKDCKQTLECNKPVPYKAKLLYGQIFPSKQCGHQQCGSRCSYQKQCNHQHCGRQCSYQRQCSHRQCGKQCSYQRQCSHQQCGRQCTYPGQHNSSEPWSGTWGPGASYMKIYDFDNVVDSNPSNYASFCVAAKSCNMTGNIAIESLGTTYPAGTFAGFTINKNTPLDWNALGNITVQLYNGNTLVEQKSTANNDLKLIRLPDGKTQVGFKSTKPFNRIRLSIKHSVALNQNMCYYVYNVFVELDSDKDGVPDCKDVCPGGDDNIDSDGDGIPDACDTTNCIASNDKSNTIDTDGDGIVNACDGDSDNDGIPDVLEDYNKDGKFENDDVDGDLSYVPVLGDGIANYLHLDSDNDGILDLFESGIPTSVINQIDKDHNGVIDSDVPVGKNGIADILETSPDSGQMRYPLKDTDGDGKPDYVDLKSNNIDYDLYAIGKGNLDDLGGGFISRIDDPDEDGIQALVDTDLVKRGAPNSPLSPYATFLKTKMSAARAVSAAEIIEVANDVKIYPNPVKAGESLRVSSGQESIYTLFSLDGIVVKTDKFIERTDIDTSSLVAGIYIIKIETKSTVKSYKIIIK